MSGLKFLCKIPFTSSIFFLIILCKTVKSYFTLLLHCLGFLFSYLVCFFILLLPPHVNLCLFSTLSFFFTLICIYALFSCVPRKHVGISLTDFFFFLLLLLLVMIDYVTSYISLCTVPFKTPNFGIWIDDL